MKANYVIIPLVTILVAAVGSRFTDMGMEWYAGIEKPGWTPPGSVIGAVWTAIYVMTALSALIFWNRSRDGTRLASVTAVFIANAILNASWSLVFFTLHAMGTAVIWSALLGLSVLGLIVLLAPASRVAAALLFPYLLWVVFATYLAYSIWTLNS